MSDDVKVLCEIAPGARVHPDARVGRWCVLGPHVQIGPGTHLDNQVTVTGRTRIGSDNRIGSGSVIGGTPQDLKYQGGETWLVIGDRNRIGRNVTINVGTERGGWATAVGDDNRLHDACHVAHDCFLGHRTTLGRKVLLAGHIVVQTGAVVEDMTGVHHFARIGQYARVGPRTPVRRDVPPFVDYYSENYYWDPPRVRGLHEAGISAAALTAQEEAHLRRALAALLAEEGALATRLDQLQAGPVLSEQARRLCQFCRESLQGRYGRYRELFRDQLPPEAEQQLPGDILQTIRERMQ